MLVQRMLGSQQLGTGGSSGYQVKKAVALFFLRLRNKLLLPFSGKKEGYKQVCLTIR